MQDAIDSYIDREGIKGDTKFLLDEINTAFDAIKRFNSFKPSLEAAKGYEAAASAIKKQKEAQDDLANSSAKLADAQSKNAQSIRETVASINTVATTTDKLSTSYDELIKLSVQNTLATKSLAQARRDLDSSFKSGLISAQDYTDTLELIKKREVEITVSNLDLNRAIRNTEKGFQSAEGSLNSLRAELNLSLQAFDRLNEADKGSDFGLELKQNINDLTTKIKEQEEGTQRFQRNVGNYQGSAKILVDALGSVEKKLDSLKEKQTQLQNFSASNPIGFKVGNQANELNQVTAEIKKLETEATTLKNITADPKFLNLAGKTGDARVEIRGFTGALVELERQGLGSTDFAVQMRKRLAELTDQVADTKDEIKALSSDTRSFDQLTSSVNLLTNTYQTFVGIQALSGDQSEETQETIKKLVAVQSISNGLQEIGEQLTKRGTLANRAYTFAQTQYAIATNASATASARLGAATKLILPLAILGGIILLVSKLNEWSNAAKNVVTQQRVLSEVSKKAADSYGQEKAKLDTLIQTIRTEGISRKAKFDSLKQLQDSYPGYFDNIKTEADLNNKLEQAYQNAAKGILLKAQAQAASDLLSENATKGLKAEIELREQEAKANEILAKNLPLVATQGEKAVSQYKKTFNNLKKIREDAFNNEKAKVDETNKFLIKSVQDSNSQIEKLGGKINPAKDVKENNKELEAELKARFELEKAEQQKIIDLHKTIADSEGIPVNVRIAERLQQFEEERKLILMQRDFELSEGKKTQSEKLLIIQNANDDILKAEQSAAAGIIAIRKQTNDQLLEDAAQIQAVSQDEIQKRTDKEIEGINKSFEARINAIEAQGNTELRAALDQYTQGKINKEQYEEEKLNIENKVRRESLLAEIEQQQKLLAISNLSPEQKAAAEKKLLGLKRQVLAQEIKDEEDAAAKRLAIRQKMNEKLKELGNELKGLAFDLLTAGVDREKNQIQEQIDLLEQKKQKDIEVANQTIANATDRAAAISIIEARSAAEKERFERRKRQLDEQRARYERLKNIADIIQSTAVAVVAALGAKPWGPQNIALAAIVGAIGAAQIARVLATPIPKFYGGKSASNKYEGMALVGDGGRSEVIIREGKTYEVTPNKPTQTYLGRNDVVVPDAKRFLQEQKKKESFVMPDAKQLIEQDFKLAVAHTGKLVSFNPKTTIQNNNQDVVRGLKSLESTIRNKKEVHIKGISKRDLILKHGANAWKYLD